VIHDCQATLLLQRLMMESSKISPIEESVRRCSFVVRRSLLRTSIRDPFHNRVALIGGMGRAGIGLQDREHVLKPGGPIRHHDRTIHIHAQEPVRIGTRIEVRSAEAHTIKLAVQIGSPSSRIAGGECE
jgi:hypothetical protein